MVVHVHTFPLEVGKRGNNDVRQHERQRREDVIDAAHHSGHGNKQAARKATIDGGPAVFCSEILSPYFEGLGLYLPAEYSDPCQFSGLPTTCDMENLVLHECPLFKRMQ